MDKSFEEVTSKMLIQLVNRERKPSSTDKNIDNLVSTLRTKREKVLKERDSHGKKGVNKLSKEEVALWECEKNLIKFQRTFLALQKQTVTAEEIYKVELWSFIQRSVKVSQAKRKARN